MITCLNFREQIPNKAFGNLIITFINVLRGPPEADGMTKG